MFQWQGRRYQYNPLPFGLTIAPRVFTKILKPLLAHLRAKGLRLVAYLDDILVIGKNQGEAEEAYRQTKSHLDSLGFVVNREKSQPAASQIIKFLGFIVNFRLMSFKLPTEKVKEIKRLCRKALQQKELSVHQIPRIVGSLSSTCLAVLPAPLHYRGLQALKIRRVLPHLSYKSIVPLESQSRTDLEWWINHLEEHNGREIHPCLPKMTIESDASNSGWGACCKDQRPVE